MSKGIGENKFLEVKSKVKRVYTPETHPVIAIDLDGTVWLDGHFPDVGDPFKHSVETINKMVEVGYEVIIWTSRGGEDLERAIKHLCEEHGMSRELMVNNHAKYYTDQYPIQSPKVGANIYLENRAYGSPIYDNYWSVIYEEFIGEEIN